ncbi:MAG: tetratricopeptide repeat protein [Deltaproteobacteria bacterium]|nr:tetratricopeptide repeat protein [Deltaproteobacteria bacterium]
MRRQWLSTWNSNVRLQRCRTAYHNSCIRKPAATHPLFLVTMVDDLKERGLLTLAEDGRWLIPSQIDTVLEQVPVSIRQLLDRQIHRLSTEEQQLVQAASLVGYEFSSAAVAAAVGGTPAAVETACNELGRRQHFLQPAGFSEWPDGVRSARYRFRHVICQDLWAERVPLSDRRQFHLRIGTCLEQAYGSRANEIASTLAVHFEQGGDYLRALGYVQQAASLAARRYAHREVVAHLTKGLALLSYVPDHNVQVQHELDLCVKLGSALIATRGYGAPEVEAVYTRALELCRQLSESPQLLQALWGLESFYAVRGKFHEARQISEQCLLLAQSQGNPERLLAAYWTLGQILAHIGELAEAREHLQRALSLYRPRMHPSRALQDPGVTSRSYLALVWWMMGDVAQANTVMMEALQLAEELGHPFSQAFALTIAASISVLQHQLPNAHRYAQAANELAQEHGFPAWFAFSAVLYGRTLWMQGVREQGLAQMQKGVEAWQRTGAEASQPFALSFLAESYKEAGEITEGLRTVATALQLGMGKN